MSPQRREHRYAPWAEPERPEPKTKAEAATMARTWAEWVAAQPAIGMYGGAVLAVPWRLDWQRNPAAPIPDGYVKVHCLCGWTICRPPEWRGKGNRPPTVTVGSKCWTCAAPYQRLAHTGAPYVAPETFYLSACLCGVRCTRHGPQQGTCEQCGAPFQVVADDQQGYVIDLSDAPEAPGWREYWRGCGLEEWAAGR